MKKAIRKVLVVNSGSSSLKYQLFDMATETRLAKGIVERIGAGGPANHAEALKKVVEDLGSPKDIDAIGHRVLHGAEVFKDSVAVTKAVLAKLDRLVKFGPLHMPANIGGIRACQQIFAGVPNVAVFDTAFHQTMPDCAAMYAIDPKYYKKMGIRKYGFHGTSHKFITEEAAKLLKKPLKKVNLVTCHMGNGSSLAAVKNGECVDTTMGLTPLAGLVMGTRCGDIDAAAVLFIMEAEKKTPPRWTPSSTRSPASSRSRARATAATSAPRRRRATRRPSSRSRCSPTGRRSTSAPTTPSSAAPTRS